ARPQREKSQSRALAGRCCGKQAVYDFVGSTVAADRQESPVPLGVGFSRKLGCFCGAVRLSYFELESSRPQFPQRRLHQLATAAPTGGGIDDGKEFFLHSALTAASRVRLPRICSASSARLIFIDAVLG